MKTLFKTMFGSRLYGTYTPTSDHDWKHIVLPDLDTLLLGKPVKNEVHNSNPDTKNTADDKDNEYIPVQVFARDFLGGQAYALELAFAIKYTEAAQEIYQSDFTIFCSELRNKFLTRNMVPLTRYSVTQALKYSVKGDRLEMAQTMASAFEQWGRKTGIDNKLENFEDTIEAYLKPFNPELVCKTEYNADGKGTMKPCIKLLERIIPLNVAVGYAANLSRSIVQEYGARVQKAQLDSGADWKAIGHAVRLTNEGISLLKGEGLTFPIRGEYRQHILDIRNGICKKEDIIAELNSNVDELKRWEGLTMLPEETKELRQEFETWLISWLRKFYGLGGKY